MKSVLLRAALLLCSIAVLSSVSFANGNETLGPPSAITIAKGSGYVGKGVGLALAQPATINLNVPVGATIKQVLLYWEGQHTTPTGDNTITAGGNGVTGTLIGGPDFFFNHNGGITPVYSSTFRADITALNLISPGANAVSVEGLSNDIANNGAGILVIFDDGTVQSDIILRDGNDLAYRFFPAPRTTTIAQTYTFDPATVARTANVTMFMSSVQGTLSTGGPQRPNRVIITVGAVTTNYDDVLNSADGEEWDTYVVPVNIPAGETTVVMQVISGPGGDEDPNTPTPKPASLAWIAGGFSIPCTGRIGDFVWKDCNANGLQDAGEAGIDGVTVKLKQNGVVIRTTVTGPNGYYQFTGLCDGDYEVEVDGTTVPAGLVPTSPCSNTAGIANNSNCSPSPVTLANDNSSDQTIDFGYKGTGTIGNLVWKDADCNGTKDGSENGIGGVTVILKQGNVIIATTTTNISGFYQFTGLCGGDYTVEVDSTTLPAECRTATTCSNTAGVDNNSNCSPSPVTIVDGATDNTIDFGYCPLCTGKIGDFVWEDRDCNGIQAPTEPGIEGVTVTITNGIITLTTSTDADGKYLFTGLCGGTYTVTVDTSTLQTGLTPTSCSNLPLIGNNSNCSPAPVTIANGGVDTTIDFGYCTPRTCLRPPDGSPCVGKNAFVDAAVQPNGDVIVTFEQSTGINDNSYGTGAVGWTNGHTFSNLTGSDKAEFTFTNGADATVLHFFCDYISATSITAATPSGYKSLGASGGDGSLVSGNIAHILSATTSLAENLNSLGLCVAGNCSGGGTNLLTNSPATNPPSSYNIVNPLYAGWKFPIVYTVKIAAAAFGASGFGSVKIGLVHNSPPKCGSNAITYVPCSTTPGTGGSQFCSGSHTKPKTLSMIYTGSNCSATSHSQAAGKVTCADFAALPSTVKIIVANKENIADPKVKKWFNGTVNVGNTFVINAANAGKTKLDKNSYWFIYNSAGTQLLQSGKFHTSCSQPLNLNDQYGAMKLVGFTAAGTPKELDDESDAAPEGFRLFQNYPNPFNPETEIYFQVPQNGQVELKIYNTLGQEVRTLVNEELEAGTYGYNWNATDNNGRPVSSGVYFYQLRAGDFSSMKKMSVLK